jgi:hypothetical protein
MHVCLYSSYLIEMYLFFFVTKLILLVFLRPLFFQGLLHYHVTNPNTPWKYLFMTMERVKQNFDLVEDYTISETTLEQVFLSFAKGQPVNS